jgi:calcium/calmodulin-dependent protein kinase (CaM kinase) II
MSKDPSQELLAENQRLLEAIVSGDWQTYAELCDPSLTAFEPEAAGQLVAGLAFHKYYFDLARTAGPRLVTMASPHVRVMGDVAVVSYVRLNQMLNASGSPITTAVDETRVWQRQKSKWRHVHFHRSPANPSQPNA